MKDTTLTHPVSYVSWILGQTSAMIGVLLILIYGFGLVFLEANVDFAAARGAVASTGDLWHPPFALPLGGLGVAFAGWFAAHLRKLQPATPVLVGGLMNLLALAIAMAAAVL